MLNILQIINCRKQIQAHKMTPLFLDQCPRKNPMRENWCNYLRVFLLSNFRVQSGCQIRLIQQRMPLAVVPLNLRQMSSLKPRINSLAAPQLQSAPEIPTSAFLDCVNLFLPNASPASAFWPSASAMLASLKHYAAPDCLYVALCEPWLLLHHSLWLLRCSPDIISASLSLCTQCPSVVTPIIDSISLSKPHSRE